MNDPFKLGSKLKEYLGERQDAQAFLLAYRDYCHHIDDIIDIPERRADNEFILQGFALGLDIFSSMFYMQHASELYPVVKIIHDEYACSLAWEKAEEKWKLTISDVIRNCANLMISTVVEIVVREKTGNRQLAYDARRDISWRAKAQSWTDHHDSNNVPV